MNRLSSKERFDRVNEARKTLATILGGVLLLLGFFGTWQSIEVAREGQITDRYTKAIEQLGARDDKGEKKLEVRLGGIYALERIANDSERDHWPIMEVLCTYVRENAPWKEESPPGEEQKAKKTTKEDQASASPPHPRADIQAILTVLGRRNRKYETKDEYLGLDETDLRGGNFYKGDFGGANLSGANLTGADLLEADLSGAYLRRAHLSGANLLGADLRGADLGRADLTGADLRVKNLGGAYFSEADLSGADLRGADLRGADLSKADLRGADLGLADLRRAYLSGADLRDAHLFVADFSGANLSGANLSGAHLSETRGLTQQQLDQAKGDADTKLPADLHMPNSWKK